MKCMLVAGCLLALAAEASAGQTTTTAPSAPSRSAVATHWSVALSKSPMDDSPTVVLVSVADAPVAVWLKAVTPELMLRCKEKQLNAYVVTNSAARVERGDTHTVRIRFDSGKAETQFWSESTDNAGLFAPDPEVLLERLRTTARLLFEFVPFNASPVVVSFNTEGLDGAIRPLIDACPEATKSKAQRLSERNRAEAARVAAAAKAAAAQLAERKRTDPLSGDLVGLSEADIRSRIGQPNRIDRERWTFQIGDRRLLIFFGQGQATDILPGDVSLLGVTRRVEPPIVSTAPPGDGLPAPAGAVARCGDDGFVYRSNGDATCLEHGGVAEWVASRPVAAPPKTTDAPAPLPEAREPLAAADNADNLIGTTVAELTRRLGSASLQSGNAWSYDGTNGTLHLELQNGKVSQVRPAGFDLKTLARLPKVTPSTAPTAPTIPSGAVAKCGDGLFVFVDAGAKTCSGHGGVSQRFQ